MGIQRNSAQLWNTSVQDHSGWGVELAGRRRLGIGNRLQIYSGKYIAKRLYLQVDQSELRDSFNPELWLNFNNFHNAVAPLAKSYLHTGPPFPSLPKTADGSIAMSSDGLARASPLAAGAAHPSKVPLLLCFCKSFSTNEIVLSI